MKNRIVRGSWANGEEQHLRVRNASPAQRWLGADGP